MYLSKYNIIERIGDDLVIYNTNTAGVLRLNDEYVDAFERLMEENTCDKEDLIKELKYGAMLLEDGHNEVDFLKIRHNIGKYNSYKLSLTIAPTLECNFACPYCYEEGYRCNTMDEATQEALVEFVKKNIRTVGHFGVSWYGGEPLLALDIIEKLTNSFLENCGENINYSAGIVTNGYNLTKDVAKKLRDLKINHAQVTIDGHREIHDKRRILVGGQGSFDRIIENIKNSCEIIPITIRINVDKANLHYLDNLLDEFEELGFKNKVHFYIAPVDDAFGTCTNTQCLTMSDFSAEEVKFMNKMLERGFGKVMVPYPTPSNCAAISLNSYVVDPKGDLYKCWNHIGHEEDKVGSLQKGPQFDTNLTKWLLYDPFASEECKNCSILPVCMGGCPFTKVVHGRHKCRSIKFNAPAVLRLFHKTRVLQNQLDCDASCEAERCSSK